MINVERGIVESTTMVVLRLIAAALIAGAVLVAATDVCTLCPDGRDYKFPDSRVPYFIIPGNEFPTCSDLAAAASLVSNDDVLCKKYQENAGYCGCSDIEPRNVCTFCPDGIMPGKANMILPTGETCRDLHTYVSFFNEDQCNSLQFEAISGNTKHCGCGTPEKFRQSDVCTFCPDNTFPPNPDISLELAGLTCGEYAIFIEILYHNVNVTSSQLVEPSTCLHFNADVLMLRLHLVVDKKILNFVLCRYYEQSMKMYNVNVTVFVTKNLLGVMDIPEIFLETPVQE